MDDDKNKPHVSFTESSSNKDSSSDDQKPENRRDPTKRDRVKDIECNGEKASYSKIETSSDKDNKVTREEQLAVVPVQQTTPYPSYNFSSTEHLFVDNSRHTMPMMTYNMMPNVNTTWPVTSYENMAMNQHNVTQPAMAMQTGLDITQCSCTGMNPYGYIGMPGDNMNGVVGMQNYCQYGGVPPQENFYFHAVKEEVRLSKCVLYPPNPAAPLPTTRERPLGCKCVFVGGLPEKITEEIVKEIFDRCGPVETIRMSKKNFCHIRFSEEIYVDNAIFYSGYRIKIDNNDEAPFTGRIHVDYAQARDDQFDYECKMRALQRQARFQEQDYYRPPTLPVIHYSDHEASLICEKLKYEETFTQAASILIRWLEKGECTKKNASSFFSMIRSTHNHVRKLQLDKVKYEEQLNEAKQMLKKQLEGIIRQFTEIEKIYIAASLQKCWDQFTKVQRKNIEMWKKQTEELKNAHLEEVIYEREDEEMELSDDENAEKNTDVEQLRSKFDEEVHKYQEEADSLRCQLETTQNEKMTMQSDHKEELKDRDDQMATLRQALQNSKKEESNLIQKRAKDQAELKELREFKRKIIEGNLDCNNDLSCENNHNISRTINGNLEREARLIGLISIFLHTHPFGAKIDYICSYLHQIDPTIRSRDLENLLKRYPMIFRQDSTGIGASLGKKWYFQGF